MRAYSQRIKIASVLVGLFLLFGPYQNCALHQSDGRKQLEMMLTHNSASAEPGCLPYLLENKAAIIWDDLTTRAKFVQSGPETQCMISGDKPALGQASDTGLEIGVCTVQARSELVGMTPANVQARTGWLIYNSEVMYFSDQYYLNPTTPPSGEEAFFGFGVLSSSGTTVVYHFVNASKGLECWFSISKSLYDANAAIKQEATRRGSLVSHEIHKNFQ